MPRYSFPERQVKREGSERDETRSDVIIDRVWKKVEQKGWYRLSMAARGGKQSVITVGALFNII